MPAPVPAVDVDEALNPLPWRGVRRLATIIAAVGVLCVVVWIVWWRLAAARYDAAVAELRARFEPLALADFPRPRVADADNAATYWKRAIAALMPVYGPNSSNFTFPSAPPYPKQWFDLERAAVVANGPAIQLALEAANHERVDWGPTPPPPFFLAMLPQLNQYRELANELGDAALDAHFKQNDAEAVRRVEAILNFSDDIGNQANSLIDYLVMIGIRALGLYRLQIIAGDMQFSDDVPNGVRSETVAALVNRLNDSSTVARLLKRAMLAERADDLGSQSWVADQQPVLRPLFILASVATLERSKTWVAVATAGTQPAARSLYGPISPRLTNGNPLTSMFDISFRVFETGWRVETEQRMIAVALALHLYEHDHRSWPASLTQLVPNYLTRVPTDPYSTDGRALGYVLATAPGSHVARPMLYCDVEPNKTPTPLPSQPSLGWHGNVSREWRDVAAWQIPEAERHLKLPSTTQP